jgi:adenylate kinase family enzyme
MKRSDDTVGIFTAHLSGYVEKTIPLIAYYSANGRQHHFDSAAPPELVFSQVRAVPESR